MNALSHTTGYAIVALGFVGSSPRSWVQAREVAEHTGIPKPYLSKILHALGRAGLIRTKRGVGGGVMLSRPATEMTLLEVAKAVEPMAAEPRCILGMAACSDGKPCPMHSFWKRVREQTREQLARTTLAEAAKYQSSTDFKAARIEDLLKDIRTTGRIPGAKPTNRFLRKFGVTTPARHET